MLREMARDLNYSSRDPAVPQTASDSVLCQASALLLHCPCGEYFPSVFEKPTQDLTLFLCVCGLPFQLEYQALQVLCSSLT